MLDIEPYDNWLNYYNPAEDERSPFYGMQYTFDVFSATIYGYYIDPARGYMGSDTLYIAVLYAVSYTGLSIIEFIGEWHDAINNDSMRLKRNVIDNMSRQGINQFILSGENILNFHGSDDCYYDEWFEDGEDGSIAAVLFP